MSPFVEFDFCDRSCDKRFSNLLATGSIGSCAQNLAEAFVGSKICNCLEIERNVNNAKGENLLEAKNDFSFETECLGYLFE